jgi:hypothetical protein
VRRYRTSFLATSSKEKAMVPILVAALGVFGLPTVYFAARSREFRKFLAGAFFVSGGMQFYFYLTQQCFGAARWHQHCPDARTQWGALNPSLHFLFGYVLFWLHHEAKGVKQVAEKSASRQVPNQTLHLTAAAWRLSKGSSSRAAAAGELGVML